MKKPKIKLYDFNPYNEKVEDPEDKTWGDKNEFVVQMFGMDENGKTYSIFVKDFKPFFYVKVPDSWGKREKSNFIDWLREEIKDRSKNKTDWYKNSILKDQCKILKKKIYMVLIILKIINL